MTRSTFPAILTLLLMAAALWIGWVGFIASDDMLYHAGAKRWATAPPFAGSDHWTTRLPLMWLFAAALRVVGDNFAAFAVTAVGPYVALVALAWLAGRTQGSARAGWYAAALVATMPVVVSHASTVSVDLMEAALLLGGAILLARDRGLAAGVCFGLAIVCRETALLALVGLGPLFLLGRPVARRTLILAGVGVAVVLGLEAVFQWVLTGDPLRRYTIAFNHDSRIDREANMEGNWLLHPAIDPLLVLLVNDDFGLLFWIAGVALLGAWRMQSRVSLVFGAMALGTFVLVAVLVTKLVLNPRYFMLPAIAAALVVAGWLARLEARRRWVVLAAVVASNLALLALGNAHPRWQVETLVIAAGQHPRETVAADPVDVRRAGIPLAYAKLGNVRYAPARAGGLMLVEEGDAPAGEVVARYPSPPTRAGALVRALGLEPLVPAPIARRLFSPSPTTILVRTPTR